MASTHTTFPKGSRKYTADLAPASTNRTATPCAEYEFSVQDNDTFDKYVAQLDMKFFATLGANPIFSADRIIALLRKMIAQSDFTIDIDDVCPHDVRAHFEAHFTIFDVVVEDTLELICTKTDIDSQARQIARIGCESADLRAQIADLRHQLSEQMRESAILARQVAMYDALAITEHRFGRIAPVQREFATRLLNAELDGTPIVFPFAQCWHEFSSGTGTKAPILPLYARSIVRYISASFTCLHSLEFAHFERLIVLESDFRSSSSSDTRTLVCPNAPSYFNRDTWLHVVTHHRRWHNTSMSVSCAKIPRIPQECHEIIFVQTSAIDSQLAQLITNSAPLFEKKRVARCLVTIDARITFANLKGPLADAKIIDLKDRDLDAFDLSPTLDDHIKSTMANAALAESAQIMNFEQWYGI
jgi:hypothetical protein